MTYRSERRRRDQSGTVAQRRVGGHIAIMHTAVTGVVHGSTVALDEPVPPLEGQRVRVTLEPLPSDELELSAEEQSRILREWAEHGPQGPMDADDAWPDES
jgi:hypothetical protein